MAFGLSFGKKTGKTNLTTEVDKTETGTQTGSEVTAGSRTGTQSTTGTTTNAATGTSSTTGTSTQAQTSTGEQRQTGTTRSLSENVLGGLESGLTGLLANVLDPNTGDRAMVTAGIDAMGGFDVDSFVQATVRRAMAQQGTQLDEVLGSLFSRVGGTEGNNSASTLLAERVRGDAAANIAGIEAGARATGAGIARDNLSATSGALAQSGGAALLPALAEVLKGGETTTDISTLTQELSNLLGQTTGGTATSESSVQGQQVTTNTTEELIQAVLSALQQQSRTVGTENTRGTTSEKGFGFGLSL